LLLSGAGWWRAGARREVLTAQGLSTLFDARIEVTCAGHTEGVLGWTRMVDAPGAAPHSAHVRRSTGVLRPMLRAHPRRLILPLFHLREPHAARAAAVRIVALGEQRAIAA